MNTDKNFIIKETVKCRQDPIYTLKKYARIKHPTLGVIPFDLYAFQEDALDNFVHHRYNIILKGRQLGFSTIVAGYVAWLITFFRNKEVLLMAIKQETAKNLIDKVRLILDSFPEWIRPATLQDNKLLIKVSNNSRVKAISTTSDAGRSESLSLLIMDEGAFIEKATEIWTAIQPTLATGGDCIVLSSPNGVGNWFHGLWVDSAEELNDFYPQAVKWSEHPDRDEPWAKKTLRAIGKKRFAQEHDCDFQHSGDNVIDPQDLEWYKTENLIRKPLEKTGFDRNFWIWEYPSYEKRYVVSADVARGDGNDYSACHVIDIERYEQVAEYKGKMPPDQFGHFLVEVATKYNNATLVIENNSIGFACIQKVIDRQYQNLYWSEKTHAYVDPLSIESQYKRASQVPGFSTTSKTRPLIISKLEEDVRQKEFIVHSSRFYAEAMTFIWINGKPQAIKSCNDDLIMSLAIGMYVRATALRLQDINTATQKNMLGNFSFSNTTYNENPIMTSSNNARDPYKWQEGGKGEDDLNWLLNKK
tara:strand:+ start:5654 stop:7243 length:1590 start_codon:yes stop_codon:yes gene_type:complete